ncbi:hypothetical protein SmJEL517_g05488 [Synchytrium microbalum]|uniref:Sodium/calcium exchanger membrane region domain-containing protein n=1 Tax=Synchytrium microbalum TaxID=1806994 RepID=A0A507BU51_9FUNG|nr:uncharacterized protein SmJEL517_g05488 [Synchytrium microbalum]TPX31102.1 hypothetical protein SmJEL517_g05488 [Synchytrium microbalum]
MTASDFFCENLSTVSTALNLSETVSGVTLAAFGNGANDLFSTVSAVKSGGINLGLGELLGSSLCITTAVLGLVLILSPFKPPTAPFFRDTLFLFGGLILILFLVLRPPQLTREAGILLVGYYVLYATVVIGGNQVNKYLRRRKANGFVHVEEEVDIDANDGEEWTDAYREPEAETSLETAPVQQQTYPHIRVSADGTSSIDTDTAPLLGKSVDRRLSLVPPLSTSFKKTRQSRDLHRKWSQTLSERSLPIDVTTSDTPSTPTMPLSPIPIISLIPLQRKTATVFESLLPMECSHFKSSTSAQKLWLIVRMPLLVVMRATVPVLSRLEWIESRTHIAVVTDENVPFYEPLHFGRVTLALFLAPFLISYSLYDGRWLWESVARVVGLSAVIGISLASLFYWLSSYEPTRFNIFVTCFGFLMATVWMSLISDQLVGNLQVIGDLLNIDESILGATVFAEYRRIARAS